MCDTCGCSDSGVRVVRFPHRSGEAGHVHGHTAPARTVVLEEPILAKNDELAARNRSWFEQQGITAVNLMSSPGAGKTTLLVRTIEDLAVRGLRIGVVEGDQETLLDTERISATGCDVVQINTGAGCHLDAEMLASGVRSLDPAAGSVVFVENVGNLVCPALFDLGESARVVLMSVTEGEDKPLKYPHMFRSADLVVLTKTDLLPYVEFDPGHCLAHARRVNPALGMIEVSATRGRGLEAWYDWLAARRA
ncbi:hydrogenase nickel incorporation protein HypB [Saccharopolyspora phatthalungensis]|uniref:Hydrogenase nickel incorporation protein HypB n=1 Tax=Saccharopolyspora phatthalungensis TaxID=664693 RepID=A0A840QEI1_9PSEU|nr:hydrogenase nickel incorporation protein HypB [Saccharopolyspora phatthalungensis]MBB5157088.1 hydrogenase nickel incorporation protein HypB [Saccharopolyspora phatthalungensis]